LAIGDEKNAKKKTNTLRNINDSCFEDFFVKKLNESVYAPKPLDMAILSNKNIESRHRKAYLMMEVVPQDTADKAFAKPEYQKWEYQKPFITEILNTMEDLLINERVFNSDLKPQNTLFDPLSRKTAIIDLGSSLYIEKNLDINHFDISIGGFGKTDKYCPPEIINITNPVNEDFDSFIDLEKSISYLCGRTIAEITSFEIKESTDLKEDDKKQLVEIVKGLINEDPAQRLSVNEAKLKIQNLGSEVDFTNVAQKQYIEKAKILASVDPSTLSLNSDINKTRSKGIIEQYLVQANPRKFKSESTQKIEQEFDDFFGQQEDKVFVILGEAGWERVYPYRLNS
jgi:serine/threonine protein kinase